MPEEGFIAEIPDAARLRHEHHLRRIRNVRKEGPVELAFFGDSIARGWEDHDELWNQLFQNRNTGLFATTNDTTSNLLWRIQNGEADGYKARGMIVLIGINNRRKHNASDTARGIGEVIRQLRLKQPQAKILLIGLLPQGHEPSHKGRVFVNEVNETIKTLADDTTLFFRDYSTTLLNSQGVLDQTISLDGTHLTPQGYQKWAVVLEKDLQQIFDQK